MNHEEHREAAINHKDTTAQSSESNILFHCRVRGVTQSFYNLSCRAWSRYLIDPSTSLRVTHPPVIAVPKQCAKEGIKQNALILRLLLQTDEEAHSYLGRLFCFVFCSHKK